MSPRLDTVLAAIDAANARDPESTEGPDGPIAGALLYGQRMSEELGRLFPDASEHLRIAARGQHIERWTLPRSDFPEGRAGYLKWRRTQGKRHADRVAGLMAEAGYPADDQARVATLLRKEGLKRDEDVQRLEDVICFVFMRWYLGDFADGRDPEQLLGIVTKTARKMSSAGRSRAVREFELPETFAPAFVD